MQRTPNQPTTSAREISMNGYWILAIVIAVAVGVLGLWIHEWTKRRKQTQDYLVKIGFSQGDAEWIADEPPKHVKNGLVWADQLVEFFKGDYQAILDAGVYYFRSRDSFGFQMTLHMLDRHRLPYPTHATSRKEFFAIVECARKVLSCRGRNQGWPQWHNERPASME